MEVRNRKQILLAVLNPGFPLCVLAFGTMTIPAAVVADADMAALVAFIDMTAEYGSSAYLYRIQYPEGVCIGIECTVKAAAESFNDLSQFKGRSHLFAV